MTSTSSPPLPRVDLSRVVDLAAALEADAQLDPETLRRRDRTLGRALGERVEGATARVEAWLDARRTGAGPSSGERALRAQRVLRTLLVLAGLLLGSSTALTVFAYDGVHPVNVVQVLAVFVALQLALVAATVVLSLPESWRRRVPGLAALQDVLRLASPGRWLPALRGLLPPAQRDAFDRAGALARRHQRLYGNAQKWSLLVASQLFGVSFHGAALVTAAGLVVFSDLAFGWSTTLHLDAQGLARWAQRLALPWSHALPDAIPSLDLIRQTQYFRGAGGFSGDAPRSAAWWRFLLLCMACYGLAPRLALLTFASWRQRAALRRVFTTLPGVADLRDRLESRWVATAASGAEAGGPSRPGAPRPRRVARPARVRAVRWSGVPIADGAVAELVADALGAELAGVVDGGAGSGRADADLVAELAAAGDPPVVLVKSWEPPLYEFLDLLGELREALGEGTPLLVVPLANPGEDRWEPAGGAHARTWARRLDAAADPWLEVVTAPETVGAETEG